MACAAAITPDTFASGLLGYVDCQAATLGAQGFAALAAPGSSVSLLLAALLTLFVALAGYRMLLGEMPGVRDGVLGIAKIGIVLALATSWPAYRTLIYDVVLRTPAELASEIGRPAQLPGADGSLAVRLDGVDRSLRILAIYGTGVPTREQVETANGLAPPLFANFDVFALGMARLTFLVGGLGAFVLLRLLAGVLLGVGPLLIAFALFAPTRGLTEGWLRALIGATLASAAVALAIGIEVALLEPWLLDLVAQRAVATAIPGAPTALLAASIVFAFAIMGLSLGILRMMGAVRLSSLLRGREQQYGQVLSTTEASQVRRLHGGGTIPADTRSRAAAIADTILAAQRIEEAMVVVSRGQPSGSAMGGAPGPASAQGVAPLGRTFRRTARRVSARASARDQS